MDTDDLVPEKLDWIYQIRQNIAAAEIAYKLAVDNLIPEDVRLEIDKVTSEHVALVAELNAMLSALEKEVKDAVLASGETIKGEKLMAVWSKGRVTWDSDVLKGYAVAHPEILVARKEGAPSVSIRER